VFCVICAREERERESHMEWSVIGIQLCGLWMCLSESVPLLSRLFVSILLVVTWFGLRSRYAGIGFSCQEMPSDSWVGYIGRYRLEKGEWYNMNGAYGRESLCYPTQRCSIKTPRIGRTVLLNYNQPPPSARLCCPICCMSFILINFMFLFGYDCLIFYYWIFLKNCIK